MRSYERGFGRLIVEVKTNVGIEGTGTFCCISVEGS